MLHLHRNWIRCVLIKAENRVLGTEASHFRSEWWFIDLGINPPLFVHCCDLVISRKGCHLKTKTGFNLSCGENCIVKPPPPPPPPPPCVVAIFKVKVSGITSVVVVLNSDYWPDWSMKSRCRVVCQLNYWLWRLVMSLVRFLCDTSWSGKVSTTCYGCHLQSPLLNTPFVPTFLNS